MHDNPAHHIIQADIITRVRPRAVVFEMLNPQQAAIVNAGSLTTSAALEPALAWNAAGWPDFNIYWPIFQALDKAVVFGGAAPKEDVRRAITEGAAALFGADADIFALDQPLPDTVQAAREADQMAAHCDALPPDMLPGFVQAQRLRDATLARAGLAALRATGGPVVIITGNGHARNDWGIPALMAQADPAVRVASLGQTEEPPLPDAPFDVSLQAPAVLRSDPCEAFR